MAKKSKTVSNKQDPRIKRPPIIVVLGHVDHGKTTLLDYIRETQVAAGEAGGITQRIGAYRIDKPIKVTFIDTPGHEAFSMMRSRGAKVADVAVLVVAADDSVMPQTRESIEYIKEAQIPAVIAINKMDLPDADARKVKEDLLKVGVACEGYGGDRVAVEISAKTGAGVNTLLEMIGLVSEMENLTADSEGVLTGVVIESSLDSKRGLLTTVLVKNGTLRTRDTIAAGRLEAKVKALFDEFGSSVEEVKPSEPVVVLGFSDIPPIGSIVTKPQEGAEKFPEKDADSALVRRLRRPKVTSSTEGRAFGQTVTKREEDVIRVVIKAESKGALESILENIPKEAEVLYSKVGDITESDIYYAATTKALVIGFNVKIPSEVGKVADGERVVVRVYNVIYELLEDLGEVVADLGKEVEETVTGRAKVLKKFTINNKLIAGVRVEEGKFRIGDRVKVERDSSVSRGKVVSIKHGKIDVKETTQGKEYGLGLRDELDFTPKDVIISYSVGK